MAFSNAAIAAYTAVSAAGATIYQAETARKGQKNALRQQQKAQTASEGAAARQQRENEQNIARANRKKPNVAGLLANAQRFGGTGLQSTNLTGPLKAPLGGGGGG